MKCIIIMYTCVRMHTWMYPCMQTFVSAPHKAFVMFSSVLLDRNIARDRHQANLFDNVTMSNDTSLWYVSVLYSIWVVKLISICCLSNVNVQKEYSN